MTVSKSVAGLLFAAGLLPAPLMAQDAAVTSAFGCKHLETLAEPRSIEGKDGFFFRIFADLRLQHTFTDETVGHLAKLSEILKQHGTTLVYVPVPTKSQAMPEHVPERAALYGYDFDVASHVYQNVIDRLRASGVVAVDLQSALRKAEADAPPFHKADFHWNSDGARLAGQAIGDMIRSLPEYQEADPTEFETTRLEQTISFSGMRKSLQTVCTDSLPAVESYAYETTAVSTDLLGGGAVDLFGENTTVPIALIGTSFSDSDVNNFDGFIQQYSSLSVTNYAITGGNQFGAILSYVTSNEFQESRPRFLVWENPIYNNLGQYGPAPWMELLAAAADSCSAVQSAEAGANTLEFEVNFKSREIPRDTVILADAQDEAVRAAAFFASDASGNRREISIRRSDRLRATGRFFVPVQAFGGSEIARLRVVLDRPSEGRPEVQLCQY
ncbi:alginate O-acetyltransferase AlgX-related protein [Roseibium sediminicola]|uniref:Alginate biosynthesis protein n=1 Tax=Roseibium sediminicola TaxID=2933272 RepID=A0ABT0GXJ1_9HYPH|nr:alginate biosynthesis protein [Roseibium sp. CAU 1639]MCK7614159.1 alginate biosynthesis protein [Roseibium sp. CAU 1639]